MRDQEDLRKNRIGKDCFKLSQESPQSGLLILLQKP